MSDIQGNRIVLRSGFKMKFKKNEEEILSKFKR